MVLHDPDVLHDAACEICNGAEETAAHIMFGCSFAASSLGCYQHRPAPGYDADEASSTPAGAYPW